MADTTAVIRPSAVLTSDLATRIVRELERRDVSVGGMWSASPGLWQRYDRPWDGRWGARGGAQLVGAIGAVYGTPTRYDITLYRVTLTEHGRAEGWTHEALADDALRFGRVRLSDCPRSRMNDAPEPLRLPGLEESLEHTAW